MKANAICTALLLAMTPGVVGGQGPAQPRVEFIPVDKDVRLEVLDWGGSGRPLVLLAGNGNTAHVFNDFAPRLTNSYHVYGITRRGFGASSVPPEGYEADRLADDVLAVIDSLGLKRPVLAGHSLAGQELSSIGSRHPEKVAGLIYLDAAYPYAFYNRARGNYQIDLNELRRHLAQLQAARQAAETEQLIAQLLDTDLPAIERALRERQKQLQVRSAEPPPQPASTAPFSAIAAGMQRYTDIRAPILAIYALPHTVPAPIAKDSALFRIWSAAQAEWPAQADAFEHAFPKARVLRIPNADHFVFRSNEATVLSEMRVFISSLPPS